MKCPKCKIDMAEIASVDFLDAKSKETLLLCAFCGLETLEIIDEHGAIKTISESKQ